MWLEYATGEVCLETLHGADQQRDFLPLGAHGGGALAFRLVHRQDHARGTGISGREGGKGFGRGSSTRFAARWRYRMYGAGCRALAEAITASRVHRHAVNSARVHGDGQKVQEVDFSRTLQARQPVSGSTKTCKVVYQNMQPGYQNGRPNIDNAVDSTKTAQRGPALKPQKPRTENPVSHAEQEDIATRVWEQIKATPEGKKLAEVFRI